MELQSTGRKTVFTPRREAWKVKDAKSGSFVPALKRSKQVRVYQKLVDHWPGSDFTKLYETWIKVWNALEDPTDLTVVDPQTGYTRRSLSDALNEVGLSASSRVDLSRVLREP